MEYKQTIKQIVEYNRKGIERFFETADQIQAKAEEYTGKALDQANYVPDEGKNFVRYWFENGQKTRGGFKDAVLKNYERIESYLTPA